MVGLLQKRMAREERKIAGAEEEGRRDRVGGGRGREEKEGTKREGEQGWGNKRVHESHHSGLGF